MNKTGFVIVKSQNEEKYFSSRSAYDRPEWLPLSEATVYTDATLAANAVTKLFKNGSFTAKIVPLSEVSIISIEPASTERTGSDISIGPGPNREEVNNPIDAVDADLDDVYVADIDPELDDEYVADADLEGECELGEAADLDDEDYEKYVDWCRRRGRPALSRDTYNLTYADQLKSSPSSSEVIDVDHKPVLVKTESVEETRPKTDTFAQGRSAGAAGVPVTKNPFSPNTPDYKEWEAGHRVGVAYTRSLSEAVNTKRKLVPSDIDEMIEQFGLTKTKAAIQKLYDEDVLNHKEATKLLDILTKQSPSGKKYVLEAAVDTLKVADPAVVSDPDRDAGTCVSDSNDAKIKVPAAVLRALKDAQKEHERDFVDGDHTEPLQVHSVSDAIQQIIDALEQKDVAGLKQAQILLSSYMNVITSKIPPIAIKYIQSGGNAISLKDMYDERWSQVRRSN